uniref:hypothetical protein n=1 Tax=Thiolapillus sp. TaxID=2017437 RepID=UPI003AF85140
ITKRHSIAVFFSKCNVADCVLQVNDCIECVGLMKENMAADPAPLVGVVVVGVGEVYFWRMQNVADLA